MRDFKFALFDAFWTGFDAFWTPGSGVVSELRGAVSTCWDILNSRIMFIYI